MKKLSKGEQPFLFVTQLHNLIHCGYSLGDSNKYPQSMFLNRNKKNNIQLTLVISNSLISNNCLSRSENLVPA